MSTDDAIRDASSSDVDALRALVHAAYEPYVDRIGMRPGPMGRVDRLCHLVLLEAMSRRPLRRPTSMTATRIQQLRSLEGRQVAIAVRGGDRIDDCQLVSAGRGPTQTLWVFADGGDFFVPLDDVVDLWEAA